MKKPKTCRNLKLTRNNWCQNCIKKRPANSCVRRKKWLADEISQRSDFPKEKRTHRIANGTCCDCELIFQTWSKYLFVDLWSVVEEEGCDIPMSCESYPWNMPQHLSNKRISSHAMVLSRNMPQHLSNKRISSHAMVLSPPQKKGETPCDVPMRLVCRIWFDVCDVCL